jgi:hypothetical protein
MIFSRRSAGKKSSDCGVPVSAKSRPLSFSMERDLTETAGKLKAGAIDRHL